jgi:4-oxalmesaconate hydratase
MIIDCHGHFMTAPKALEAGCNQRTAGIKDSAVMPKVANLKISDDELRETIEANQLRLMKERGADFTIFSPRASFMAYHIGDFAISSTWASICTELCYRVSKSFPTISSARRCCRKARASIRQPAFPNSKDA